MQQQQQQSQITLISKEGTKVSYNIQLAELCDIINNSNLDEDIPVTEVSTVILEDIQRFCAAHSYDGTSMKYIFPFISDQLSDHVDSISYTFLSNILGSAVNTEDRIKCLSPYLDAAFYLGFTKLKKIINVTIQVQFYCDSTESGQEQFIKKWHIQQEDISDEQLKQVADYFKPLFHAYRETNTAKLKAIYDEYQTAKRK